MSRNFSSIPKIDISGLSSPDWARRAAVGQALREACRDVGFFYILGHGVPEGDMTDLRAAAERFFAQPLTAKMQSYIGHSLNHSGYVPEGEEVFEGGKIDKKEAYDIGLDYRGSEQGAPLVGPNLWPELEGFQAAVGAYYTQISALSRLMFRGFALALGQPEDHFDGHLTAPPSQLRMIHYPHDPNAVDAQGIGAHTDYEVFTLLFSTAPGLEVLNGEGVWIDAPPVPGAFIVNIGDMLEAMSNGEFLATSHRVRKVAEERYSFPFFSACDYWTAVEPLANFVDPARPARYGRLISGEHLYAQTAQTFAYLKRRIASGEARMPAQARSLSSFGPGARQVG